MSRVRYRDKMYQRENNPRDTSSVRYTNPDDPSDFIVGSEGDFSIDDGRTSRPVVAIRNYAILDIEADDGEPRRP